MGFGGLLLLMGILGLSAISFLYQVEIRQDRIRQDYVERDRRLEKLRSDIYLSGTYIRDFVIDADEDLASAEKRRFLETRRAIESGMSDYRGLLRPEERDAFQALAGELAAYFDILTPALNWSPAERRERGYRFIQKEVLPRRMLAVGLADGIQQVSEKQLESSGRQVSEMFSSFRTKLLGLLVLTLAIGAALTGVSMWRLLYLERLSETAYREIVGAREELKQLSSELLSAQESERRRISRELHDEVGQVMSATMLAAGNLGAALKQENPEEALRQLQLIEEMTERNARVVRNISLLLRPAVLDDLGLVPALRWLAREVTRNQAVQVDVIADDFPDALPEDHRTCVYRVVQESLRNACRHSGAQQIRIHVSQPERRIRVSVQDDGKGFDTAMETGMGILGMEERVLALGGVLKVESEHGRGATVWLELPLPEMRDPAEKRDRAQEMRPFRTA